MKYTLENSRWVADRTNPVWANVLGSAKEYAIHAFVLRYFNNKHEDVAGQIVDKGEGQHHQHFFTASNIKPSYGEVEEATDGNNSDLFNCTYCDADPWNKTDHDDHTVFNDDDHPIRLKGYFAFKHAHKQSTLSIRLMYAR